MVSSVSFCPNLTLNPWTLLFPFLMQLFKTVNHDVIHDCCKYFAFILPREIYFCDIIVVAVCIGIMALL